MGPLRFSLAAFSLLSLCGPAAGQSTELVGPLTRDALLEKLPEWNSFVLAYSPDLEVVSRLQKVPEDVQVEVFLGTWCPDCRQHVSAYLKLMDMVRNPLIKSTFTGIPRQRELRQEYIAGRNVERVPTFIVHFRGREIGRLIETPKISVEADLWEILAPELGDR
jgi:hypothetical protein